MKFKIHYSDKLGKEMRSRGILVSQDGEKELPDTGYFLDWVWVTFGLDSQVLLKPTPPDGMDATVYSAKDLITTG